MLFVVMFLRSSLMNLDGFEFCVKCCRVPAPDNMYKEPQIASGDRIVKTRSHERPVLPRRDTSTKTTIRLPASFELASF